MTQQNAHLYLPLVQALADGKTIQTSNGYHWHDEPHQDFVFSMEPAGYRIKPEPVMVPLGPEDVPPGSVVRQQHYNKGVWHGVGFVTTDGVAINLERESKFLTYQELNICEIKRPGQDWMPCSKTAE